MQRLSYHSDIDSVTVHKWWKVEKTGDYKHLSRWFWLTGDLSNKSEDIYDRIFDQFIQMGGISEAEHQMNERKRQLSMLVCDIELVGELDDHQRNILEYKAHKLATKIHDRETEMNKKPKVSRGQSLAIISSNVGSHISSTNITLAEYCSYVNEYTKVAA